MFTECTLQVAPRYCGPPASANGGYVCGLVAAAIGRPVTLRLVKPIPVQSPLNLRPGDDGLWRLFAGDVAVIEVRDAQPPLVPPAVCEYASAAAAALQTIDPAIHPCPGCFVCGPARAVGDGLRLSAGAVAGRDIVATPWRPAAEFAAADGTIVTEIVAAALDCPGYQSLRSEGGFWLLGEYTVHQTGHVRADEACVITGWEISRRGRIANVGTALYGADGGLRAVAAGTWIQPRSM